MSNPDLKSILTAALRSGIAHNNGAGGQYLLCATEAQLCAFAAALAPTEAAAMAATVPAAEPMFWVRLRSDGGYEGPIHNDAIERVRKESGGWTPLYPDVSPTEAAAELAGWQSMESAPRDGTHILAWLPDSETCYVVCWADASNGIRKELGSTRPGWHLAWDGYRFDAPAPDYWHPLPDGPELDAWKCDRCHGKGWHWEAVSINHGKEIGVENVDLKTSCDDCEGVGWCGPDADRAAPKGDSNG
ncbi:hypothetical protein LJR066_002790 [Acidovorax sp. LjRoot66]|uniref:hypothetical protein n=1 Tax=Acidovorax sp. LjRoot66 TaxID=3342334 RepID=UPI003ECF124F